MSRIMLAEDDLTMIALLKTLLGMEGYEVVALALDDDIIESVRNDPPDILLMDVHLPFVNGIDVLEKIRSDEEVKDLKIVMTSGLNLEFECIERGANDFLTKPYMPDDLLTVLKRNLNPS